MARLLRKAVVAAIVLIQLTYADCYDLPEGTRLAFDSEFISYDWTLLANETEVVYSRNVRPDRVFAYATYNQSEKRAYIQIAKTNRSSPLREDKCQFDFKVPNNSKVVIDNLRIYGYDREYHAPFTWHVEGKEDSVHLDSVNILTCHHAEYVRELLKERKIIKKPMKPRAEEMEAAAAEETGFDLAKLELPKSYHYAHEVHTGESAVHIRHVNSTSASVDLAGKIKAPPKSHVKADSVNMDRYGVCWQEDKNITCAQGPMRASGDSSRLTNWATISLLEPAAWMGVHNYAESKMLVLVGSCTSNNVCSYFELYEVRPDGKVIRHTTDHMLLGPCSKPSDITVDAFDDPVRKTTCFSAVCLNELQMKLRRKCAHERKVA